MTITLENLKGDLEQLTYEYFDSFNIARTKINEYVKGYGKKNYYYYSNLNIQGKISFNKNIEEQKTKGLGENILKAIKKVLINVNYHINEKNYNKAFLEFQSIVGSLEELPNKFDLFYRENKSDQKTKLNEARESYQKIIKAQADLKEKARSIESFPKTKSILEKFHNIIKKIKKKFINTWSILKEISKCVLLEYFKSSEITKKIQNDITQNLESLLDQGANFVGILASLIPGLNFILIAWRVVKLISPLFRCLDTFIKAFQLTNEIERYKNYGLVFGNLLLFFLYIFTGIKMDFKFDLANPIDVVKLTSVSLADETEEKKLEDLIQ